MKIQLFILACLCAGSLAATNARKVCATLGIYNVAHNSSCSRYYICFNQQLVEQECATGLLYDRDLQVCVQASLTECRLSLCPTNQRFAMVADPNDCDRYFVCSNGVATSIQCPAGLLFNTAIGSCDFESNVNCVSDEVGNKENQIEIQCPATGVMKVPNPNDCSMYSICVNGNRMDYQCSGDLHYDTRTKRCNFAEISRCFE